MAIDELNRPTINPSNVKKANPAMSQPKTKKMAASTQKAKMERSEIMAVQKALDKEGFHLKIDGLYGPHTRTALKDFQKKHGLTVTGKPDTQTLAALGIK